ncbi:unnamed protein product [Ilex paraguariensis]|uniref:PCI domain-containing protein n=1 Tax=Ilex paraguariensis TaxID=185542 RepID=A0ABC8T1E4_9AQUA
MASRHAFVTPLTLPALTSSVWINPSKLSNNYTNSLSQRDPYQAPPYNGTRDSGGNFPTKYADVQAPKRNRSPPLPSTGEASQEYSLFARNDLERPALTSSVWINPSKLSNNYTNSLAQRDLYQAPPYIGTRDSGGNLPTQYADVQVPKRNRSPPLTSTGEASQENSLFARNDLERPFISPPGLSTRPNGILNGHDPQSHQWSSPSAHATNAEAALSKLSSSPGPKRTRLPSLPSTNQVLQENSYTEQDQDDIERELQAKAKRLARFKNELNQPVQSSSNIEQQKLPMKRQQAIMETQNFMGERSTDLAGDLSSSNFSCDHEGLESSSVIIGLCPDMCPGLESSSVIIGLCPDMCPESERAERERKGDLDQYERVDGDRNQTSRFLAVKKYTRTAEREAELIRPMLILQSTIDYLLNLLDQPYDDRFLGLYNFLWDRMRAIRMDLRMQHIFNTGAVTMLEQMIRLHIIAMHELCEYTRGEGFSEGFDAHLNIEQMNKTSVELFQLYDDHRKKGIDVPTEKEFRGYYALLKLDKHPGYKVEPAELSLGLAKMTPEIRQTSEVLFARDVARACRTGNFIAFFRLARKASFLQACLMHAHFAKLRTQALASLHCGLQNNQGIPLRTQALASLHCGLQNNQGIPVSLISKWLGMEEEDIENLLEYHGFSIKEFEEPYMVKEGPFLNVDNDYAVKCSKLVHLKKSRRINEDVSFPCIAKSLSSDEVKDIQLDKVYEYEPDEFEETQSGAQAVDEEMLDYKTVSSPKDDLQLKPMWKTVGVNQWNEDNRQVPAASPLPWSFSVAHSSPKSQEARVKSAGRPNYDSLFRNSVEKNINSDIKAKEMQVMPRILDQERVSISQVDSAVETSVPQFVAIKDLEDEDRRDTHQEVEAHEVSTSDYDEEVAEAKLKLLSRIWRRRSSKKRELREQRQLAASAALSSLSLGPPLWHYKDQPSTFGELNIDRVLNYRYEKHEQSWSRLNVSEVIAAKLGERNPDAKCLCWKLILCSQGSSNGDKLEQRSLVGHVASGPWLLSKLMPSSKDDSAADELVISSPSLSVWKKWIPSRSGGDQTCCLSVIKDTKFDNLHETVAGGSAVLFLVSEYIPWGTQKIRLHNLLVSLPSGSGIPLLILSGSCVENLHPSTIVKELGLHDIDKSRVNAFLILSLVKSPQKEHLRGFFSDEQLREGLQWLANESPLQPALCSVKTRDLVLSHLNSSLDVLDEINAYSISPEYCVSAFNDALDRSMREIADSANSNPSCWPCPEIALLEGHSDEHRVVVWYLPSIGWSSDARIGQLISALSECKLQCIISVT